MRVPLYSAASTTRTPADIPLMMRLRMGKFCGVGAVPRGTPRSARHPKPASVLRVCCFPWGRSRRFRFRGRQLSFLWRQRRPISLYFRGYLFPAVRTSRHEPDCLLSNLQRNLHDTKHHNQRHRNLSAAEKQDLGHLQVREG